MIRDTFDRYVLGVIVEVKHKYSSECCYKIEWSDGFHDSHFHSFVDVYKWRKIYEDWCNKNN